MNVQCGHQEKYLIDLEMMSPAVGTTDKVWCRMCGSVRYMGCWQRLITKYPIEDDTGKFKSDNEDLNQHAVEIGVLQGVHRVQLKINSETNDRLSRIENAFDALGTWRHWGPPCSDAE